MLTSLLLPQAHATLQWERLPWAYSSRSGNKRAQGGHPYPSALCLSLLVGATTLDLPHGECCRVCRIWLLGMCDGECGAAWNNKHSDFGKLSPFLQQPSSSHKQQLCSYTKSKWWHSLTRELGMVQACLIQDLRRILSTLESSWPPPRYGNWVIASSTIECNSLSYQLTECKPYLTQKRCRNTWKFVASFQFSSAAQLCLTLCDPMDCSMPGLPVYHHSRSLLKLMSTESMMPSNHLSLCRLLLLLSSTFPSIRVFSSQSVLRIRWPKYWSFSISLYNECSRLISFRMDSLELLAVQGTLNSLLHSNSSNASILWCSAFLIFQLSHPYMTTGKTIALTTWTFVGKVMSLLFNMLSRLVITFLPKSSVF